MANQLSQALAQGRRAILDSTGMSFRFRALVVRVRADAFHVHLTVDLGEWREREARRTDRPPLDASIYRRSARIVFPSPPDLVVNTTPLTPGDLADRVAAAWERSEARGANENACDRESS
jgi:chloramphenicol 3-O-phosphotransferase